MRKYVFIVFCIACSKEVLRFFISSFILLYSFNTLITEKKILNDKYVTRLRSQKLETQYNLTYFFLTILSYHSRSSFPAVIAQIVIPTAEYVIPTGTKLMKQI